MLLGGLAASPELAAAYARCAAVASRLPGDETWTGDLAFPRADGNRAVAESVLVPLCTGDGTLSSLIVVGRDVTAARAAAAALADAERRFTLAFTQAPIGVLLTSLDTRNFGRLLSANPALCRMLGYGRTQLLERTLADITHPEDVPQLDAQLQEVLGGARSSLHLEVRQLRADGGVLWASISASVVRDLEDRSLYAVTHVEDITQQRADRERLAEANGHLADANAALQSVNEELDRFTATVAHDLKSPLTSISGYAELLLDDSVPPGSSEAAALDAIGATPRACRHSSMICWGTPGPATNRSPWSRWTRRPLCTT